MSHTYRIAKEDSDPTAIVIEKGNITAEFTIAQMRSEQAQCEKLLKEFRATLEIETAAARNIEEHHPGITGMSEQDLFTAAMYAESTQYVKQLPPKIKELEDQLASSKEEEAHIIRELGITLDEESKA